MPRMNLISGEPIASQLSPKEQKFLAEETTNRQVVQDQASAAAMVEAEKAKAAEWAEVREQWRVKAEKARQEEKQGAEAKAAATGSGGALSCLRSVGTTARRAGPDDT